MELRVGPLVCALTRRPEGFAEHDRRIWWSKRERFVVEVRVGVVHAMKEIEIELDPTVDRAELRKQVDTMLSDGHGVLWLTDRSGREVGIPVERVAYVDFGRPSAQRSIGFSG